MATPQISELLLSIVKTPRGLVALLAVLGSLVAFVHLFLLKSSSSPSPKSKSKSLSKRSADTNKKTSSTRRVSAVKGASKTTKKSEPKKSKDEQQAAGPSVAKKTASPTKKSSNSKKVGDEAVGKGKKSVVAKSVSKQAGKVSPAANSKPQADDGEWIKVAKKRTRKA